MAGKGKENGTVELKKESVQVLRVKSSASSQVTFDADYNVPDVKPDIGRMIQNKGEVSLDEVRLAEGKAFLKGNLLVELLYVGDGEGRVCSMAAQLPFDETLNLEGIASGDKLCLRWEMEDLSLRLIHSRKISIKAIVTFTGTVDETAVLQLPTEAGSPELSVKKKTLRLMCMPVHKKDTLRVKEEITLASNKPNIAQLLWQDIQVRALELRPEEGHVRARGELAVFALYEGDDEGGTVQWVEYTLPFGGEVECAGCLEEMIPDIEVSVMHRSMEVKPDADGEERVLLADLVLEMDMKLYQEEEHLVIQDVYTPVKECIPQRREEELECLLVRNLSKCRISDRIEVKETQGKILQLCQSQGRVKIDKTRIVENGILAEGIVHLKVLYIVGDDNMPFYSMEAMLPFTHVAEARGITPDCTYCLKAELEQLSTTMADSNEIEVKAAVSLNVLVKKRSQWQIIERVEEKPLDMEKIQSMPGITVYVTKQEDTLWDIAKHFYTTVEEICDMNELSGEEIKEGQPLLLVKKVEG